MKTLLEKLYPLNRLALSDGTDQAMALLQVELPDLKIFEVPSGTECWTWIVPEKWVVREAYISDGDRRIVDMQDHPLHVASYSPRMEQWVSREELLPHLHVAASYLADMGYRLPERPHAIPWVVNYYQRDWGFCLQKQRLDALKGDRFFVKIDAEFVPDTLKIGDLTVPGRSQEMIVFITNICHPYQVNDSISGLVVAVDIAKQLAQMDHHYTYKFLFLPETIGSIAYLSHHEHLIPLMKYGLFAEMLGHENDFVMQRSAQGHSPIDRVAEYVLKRSQPTYRTGEFREVLCNDEISLNGPGVNVPTISLSRWPYPQYHTNEDCPDIISEVQLESARDLILEIFKILDADRTPIRQYKGPIFLSRYGLWVEWRESDENRKLLDRIEKIMLLMEGELSVFDIAEKVDLDFWVVLDFLNKLHDKGLIEWQTPS
ncbi:hypothetical protein DO97_10830 [Neosynechococcus sphagnicola sy1]|uniref:Aminopeptidase n=1 Tax=Neosynechococcus sphagnicola sy1 TaxID=1497020 RepID=A0A098TJF9_9CYAN|nr:DUF4910 domain-containing protein [Neosynechococcus sphagnicola]KGF72294.1 hypothetical protein DO97_10830 [Neosynechococcus sphagnicola sy1]